MDHPQTEQLKQIEALVTQALQQPQGRSWLQKILGQVCGNLIENGYAHYIAAFFDEHLGWDTIALLDPREYGAKQPPMGESIDKTFIQLLAEADEEFSYTIRSTADIHRPENFAKVRLGLTGYRIIEFEVGKYLPLQKQNDLFPDEPNSACYEIKVITGLPLDLKSAVQLVAMHVRIHQAHIRIDGEGASSTDPFPAVHTGAAHEEKPEGYKPLTTPPDEYDPDPNGAVPKDAQSRVGMKRVIDFMKELEAGRKEREKETRIRKVYESYVTTHRGFPTLAESFRKGYYGVITYTDDTAEIHGPFSDRDADFPYRDYAFENQIATIKETQDDLRKIVCSLSNGEVQK